MNKLLRLLAVLLPLPLKLLIYRRIMGWQIGQNVRIGFSYIDADQISIDENVYIGHFNVIRCVKQLQIGKNSRMTNFNQLFGRRDHPRWPSQLTIGENVQFMSHHFIDAGGIVTIGDRTTIGGRDTQIWSHSLTYETGEGVMGPLSVTIGQEVYIGARATLVGCQIPDKAVVGAGSVVTKDFSQETGRILIAGNPGTLRKRYQTATVAARN
jgi:acetyltransferase-like isoleucine patch superfamily enzyme